MVTPSAIIFIGLNVHRILSIVSIILVFAAVVTIMVE